MAKTNVLDAIMNVNTIFTGIVFLGISLNSAPSSGSSNNCAAGPEVAERLVMFEIISFSCFLFSTLAVHGLKIHLNLIIALNPDGGVEGAEAQVNPAHRRMVNIGVLVSAVGSFFGFLFLMISIVHVIEIRLGSFSCVNKYSTPSVSILSVSAFLGLATFLAYVIHGYYSLFMAATPVVREQLLAMTAAIDP